MYNVLCYYSTYFLSANLENKAVESKVENNSTDDYEALLQQYKDTQRRLAILNQEEESAAYRNQQKNTRSSSVDATANPGANEFTKLNHVTLDSTDGSGVTLVPWSLYDLILQ